MLFNCLPYFHLVWFGLLSVVRSLGAKHSHPGFRFLEYIVDAYEETFQGVLVEFFDAPSAGAPSGLSFRHSSEVGFSFLVLVSLLTLLSSSPY